MRGHVICSLFFRFEPSSRSVDDWGDEEEIVVVAGDANRGSGGDGFAGVVGDGGPAFSFDEDVAGGGERFHGGCYVADESFHADEGFTAAGADCEAQQEDGDKAESD